MASNTLGTNAKRFNEAPIMTPKLSKPTIRSVLWSQQDVSKEGWSKKGVSREG